MRKLNRFVSALLTASLLLNLLAPAAMALEQAPTGEVISENTATSLAEDALNGESTADSLTEDEPALTPVPTDEPTAEPTPEATAEPTAAPTEVPAPSPTASPEVTAAPALLPEATPTPTPAWEPEIATPETAEEPMLLAEEAPIDPLAEDYVITDAASLNNLFGTPWVTVDDTGKIANVTLQQEYAAKQLIFLSNTNPALYQTADISIVATALDVTRNTVATYTDGSGVTHSCTFQGLGSATSPFQGAMHPSQAGAEVIFSLDHALFSGLSNQATEKLGEASVPAEKFILKWDTSSFSESETVDSVLAESFVFDSADKKDAAWQFTLYNQGDNNESYPFAGIIGTMSGNNATNKSTLSLVTDLKDSTGYRKNISIRGSGNTGLLCGTMNADTQLDITGVVLPDNGYSLSSSAVAGGLVGSMATGTLLTCGSETQPASLTLSNVNTNSNGNVGVMVGEMATGARLAVYGDVSISGSTAYTPYTDQSNAGYLIGSMTGAELSITGNVSVNGGAETAGPNGNAGGVVGSMTGGSVTVSGDVTIADASITSGYPNDSTRAGSSAGGLVGSIGSTGALYLAGSITATGLTLGGSTQENNVISTGSAGGLVGVADNGFVLQKAANDSSIGNVFVTGCTIQQAKNCGGLIGSYTMTANQWNTVDKNYTVTVVTLAPLNSGFAGGLIGQMYAKSDFTVDYSGIVACQVSPTITSAANSNLGGLIGKYTAAANGVQLTLQGPASAPTLVNGTVTGSANPTCFGGLLGSISGNSNTFAYIKINSLAVSTTWFDTKNTYNYGGLVGKVESSSTVRLDINTVAISSDYNKGGTCGGLVGDINGNGHILRLSGTTDLTNMLQWSSAKKCGQLVGSQVSALIFADAGWVFKRGPAMRVDDIGNYGEVIRLTDESGKLGFNRLFVEDATNKKISLVDHSGSYNSASGITLSDAYDFAALAITLQTNGKFNAFGSTAPADLLKANIVLTADIDMSGTGIQGLTRDNGGSGTFTGTLDGQNHRLIVPVGKPYGKRGEQDVSASDSGSGQCYQHGYYGLFAKSGNITVKDLNLSGNMYFGADSTTFAGGIAAQVSEGDGVITLSNVTTIASIIYDGNGTSYVSPLLGQVISGSGISATNVTVDTGAAVTYSGTGTHYIGGLASQFSLPAGSFNFNKVSTKINVQSTDTTVTNPCYIGGMVGSAELSLSDSTFTDCSSAGAVFTYQGQSKTACIGGYIAYLKNSNADSPSINFSGNNVVGSTITVGFASVVDEACVGGLIAEIPADSKLVNLNLTNLQVTGQKIDTNAKVGTGGLLGHLWSNLDVLLTGVSVTSCTLTATKYGTYAANWGGLVYRATGRWRIRRNNASNTYGLQIQSSNFTGYAKNIYPGNKKSDAMLVSWGYTSADQSLYLEVENNAYSIAENVVIKEDAAFFDEFVGVTRKVDTYGSSGQGVVSIGTAGADGTFYTSSTSYAYANQTTNSTTGNPWASNPWSRYYYNLDTICQTNADGGPIILQDGAIDSPQKLVAWSLLHYAASNLTGYFAVPKTTDTYTVKDTLDLTGYSYYPVDSNDTNIDGATITFDSDGIATNTAARTPETYTCQHWGMHAGLFRNVTGNLSVKGLTLCGSVGRWNVSSFDNYNTSGALICGSFASGSSTTSTVLTIDSLTLKDVYITGVGVTDANYPLLINTIATNGYCNATFKGIRTTTTQTNGNGYALNTNGFAASTLLGIAGSSSATKLVLNFTEIALDGRIDDGDKITRYATSKSIFSTAILLSEFMYRAESSGSYIFNQSEDWLDNTQHTPQTVTYGAEISNATSGRNQTNQYYYYDTDNFVNATAFPSAPAEGEQNSAFLTGYRRYVASPETTNSTDYHHELDINLKKGDLVAGCGTYGDPYQITTANQLYTLQQYLANGNTPNWIVCYNKDKAFCTPTEGSETHHTYFKRLSDGNWQGVTDAEGTVSTTDTMLKDDMANYLRNAYYKISRDLSLPNTFVGIGSTTYPFCGVIVGSSSSTPTITISTTASSGFGGLINVSMGSVVKDLKLTFSKAFTVDASATVNNTQYGAYFGGVIGDIENGDNIIDNVSVAYASNARVALSGNYARNAYIGGYVGLIKKGGVIFKSMQAASGLTNVYKSNNVAISGSDNYFYQNPYVGCVLDGFAVSTDTPLDNTDKNYKITTLTNAYTRLQNTNKKTVPLTSKEDLFLISVMLNSSSISGNSALPYGKCRTSDYSNVGAATATNDSSYTAAAADEGLSSSSSPYFVFNYLPSSYIFTNQDVTTLFFSPNVTYDMTGYGSGFRGIGARHQMVDNENSFNKLATASGNNAIIQMSMNASEYTNDPKEVKTNGIALFPRLHIQSLHTINGLSIQNSTIGLTQYSYSTGAVDTYVPPKDGTTDIIAGVGALVGTDNSSKGNSALQGCSLQNVTVNGTTLYTGGLAGYSRYDIKLSNCTATGSNIRTENCPPNGAVGGLLGGVNGTLAVSFCSVSSQLLVSGGTNAGGLVGYSVSTANFSSCSLSDTTVTSNSSAGGLVGYAGGSLTITDCIYAPTSEANSFGLKLAARYTSGGLVGNCTSTVDIKITADRALSGIAIDATGLKLSSNYGAGGLVGASTGTLNINNDTAGHTLSVHDIFISTANSSESSNITGGIGGLVGYKTANLYAQRAAIYDFTLNGTTTKIDVGGVVGYANYGQMTYDSIAVYAKSQASSILTGTSADSNLGAAGGMIGYCDDTSTYTNCTVNANDSASHPLLIQSYSRSGGFFGKNEYDVTLNSCTVGNDQTDANVLIIGASDRGSGGIAGENINRSLTAKDITLKNLTILSGLSGGISGWTNGLISLSNVAVQNCNLLSTSSFSTSSAGGLIATTTSTLTGKNILLKNSQIGFYVGRGASPTGLTDTQIENWKNSGTLALNNDTIALKNGSAYTTYKNCVFNGTNLYSDANVGVWVGSAGDGNVQLSGVRRDTAFDTDSTALLPQLDVGSYKTLNNYGYGYIVYADYTGTATVAANLTTSPASGVTAGTTLLTGDGACFTDTEKSTTIPSRILADYSSSENNANKIYQGVKSFINDGYTEAKLGTYAGVQGITGDTISLPVLRVDDPNDSAAVTKIITDYLNLLTNDGYTSYLTAKRKTASDIVSAASYTVAGTSVTAASSPSLAISGNNFSVPTGRNDYQKNQFTLLTVNFDGYTLYVPVIVMRVVRVTFHPNLQNGTIFEETGFTTTQGALVSHGEAFTALLQYTYDYDWLPDLNNGARLFWGYDKQIRNTLTGSLPQGTQLTLVDASNKDHAYYYTVPEGGGNQFSFSSFTDKNGKPWTPTEINDLLALTATASTGGSWMQVDDSSNTVTATGPDGSVHGYRPAVSANSETGEYAIGLGNLTPTENYYLTVKTPSTETQLLQLVLRSTVTSAEGLASEMKTKVEGAEGQGYLYQSIRQELSDLSSNTTQSLTATGDTIKVTYRDKITCDSNFAAKLQSSTRYLQFAMRMSLHKDGESDADIGIISPVSISIAYYLYKADGTTMINASGNETTGPIGTANPVISSSQEVTMPLGPEGNPINLVPLMEKFADQGFIAEAQVTLQYTANAVRAFPQSKLSVDNLPNNYVTINSSACLAANKSNLYRGAKMTNKGNKRYYRDADSLTTLSYNKVGSLSQLGINASDLPEGTTTQLIHSAGVYNLLGLETETINTAKNPNSTLVCTLKLYNKNDYSTPLTGPGALITLNALAEDGTISTAIPPNSDGSYTWTLPNPLSVDRSYQDDTGTMHQCYTESDGTLTIPFDIYVNPAVESLSAYYANYKIELSVELKDSQNEILDSPKADFFKYTLARVSTSILKKTS